MSLNVTNVDPKDPKSKSVILRKDGYELFTLDFKGQYVADWKRIADLKDKFLSGEDLSSLAGFASALWFVKNT